MDAVDAMTTYALQANTDYDAIDRIYVKNQLLALVGETPVTVADDAPILDVLDALVNGAVTHGVIGDSQRPRAELAADVMNLATPLPSTVTHTFWARYADSPEAALDYFYQLSRANNYIQTRAIARNIEYRTPTEYGDLEITINLSKPEKDPHDIAAAGKRQSHDYPQCALCLENEGYEGSATKAERANHRVVRMTVGGQPWGFQYSPYAYFSEHAIFLDDVHRPMHITAATFTNLLDIVTTFPQYFVGSNADLPIVGGSMLTHEHYQGGRHDFPMARAQVETPITVPGFPDVVAGIVKWPMSVIRLTAAHTQRLAACAERVRAVWADYSDTSVSIQAHSKDGTPHHTVTPIARRVGDAYQLDIVLRDNNTSVAYPDGIFHPHPDVQHIKRENIGLIEVMGLAILPARLVGELAEVRKFLLSQPSQVAPMHQAWAEQLKHAQTWQADTATAELQQAVGRVFARVLADAGVFKRDAAGRAAFNKFCSQL